jgi:Dolichyl-phosphate-mannose-protein mannosyltransferase
MPPSRSSSPPEPSRAERHGLLPADRRVERTARVIAVVACTWFALAACWGIAGSIGAGHVAMNAARGIMAENMLHWHIWGPVREYTAHKPSPTLYYCHHPWGTFWLNALIMKAFGRHDFVCRLAPVLESIAIPALLYGIGRALWSPMAGALSASAYVVLPIALAFANVNGFEVPLNFGCLLTTWGYVRYCRTWHARWAAVSLLGLVFCVNTDWEALVFAAIVLVALLGAHLLLPRRWFGGVDTRRFSQWWALAAGLCVATVLLYIGLFRHSHALADFLEQGQLRAGGNEAPLATVLKKRSYWIELMFTPLAILVGKVAAPLFALRVVVLRRVAEVFGLAILVMAVFEYVYFKEGADVHIYWPLPFAPYFALALGVLAASTEDAVRWLARRVWQTRLGVAPSFAVLGVFLLVPLFMIHDGVSALVYGRRTGDRFDEGGRVVYQMLDKTAALKWLRPQIEGRSVVGLHTSMRDQWSILWALDHATRDVAEMPHGAEGDMRYFIADARFLSGALEREYVGRFHVEAVGPIWFCSLEEPAAPMDGFALGAHKPSFWQWYFRQGVDPVYAVHADAFCTWELRDTFGQKPNPPPGAAPRTAEDRRIAYNMALARGDSQSATRLENQILATLDRHAATVFDDGTRLLGTFYDRSTERLWIYFQSNGPSSRDEAFTLRSVVDAQMPFSLVPADTKQRVVAALMELSTTLWKKGYIYATESEIRPRPGTESFFGYWELNQPRPVSGPGRILLLTVH